VEHASFPAGTLGPVVLNNHPFTRMIVIVGDLLRWSFHEMSYIYMINGCALRSRAFVGCSGVEHPFAPLLWGNKG
jgi:hypothetical protein